MTSVLLLGATGRSGALVLTSLPSDVQVIAAVRRPNDIARLPGAYARHRHALIDLDDPASLRRAAASGVDVVVNAVRLRGDIPPRALVDLHERIVGTVRGPDGGPARTVTIGGAGALRLPDGSRFWRRPEFPRRTVPRGRAHALLRDHLEASADLSWTYLIPPPAFDPAGPRTGAYGRRSPGVDEHLFRGAAVGYADFAHAVADAVMEGWVGTHLVASSSDARDGHRSASSSS